MNKLPIGAKVWIDTGHDIRRAAVLYHNTLDDPIIYHLRDEQEWEWDLQEDRIMLTLVEARKRADDMLAHLIDKVDWLYELTEENWKEF